MSRVPFLPHHLSPHPTRNLTAMSKSRLLKREFVTGFGPHRWWGALGPHSLRRHRQGNGDWPSASSSHLLLANLSPPPPILAGRRQGLLTQARETTGRRDSFPILLSTVGGLALWKAFPEISLPPGPAVHQKGELCSLAGMWLHCGKAWVLSWWGHLTGPRCGASKPPYA